MISTRAINSGEDSTVGQSGKIVFNLGQWETVFDGDVIQSAIIYTPSGFAIFLGYRKERETPR